MDIDHQAMVTDHRVVAVIARHLATAIVRRPVTASVHRPAETIVHPAVAVTDRRPAVATDHRLVVATARRLVAVAGLAADIVRPRVDSKGAIVRHAPKPNPRVNSFQDKRRDFRGVCH